MQKTVQFRELEMRSTIGVSAALTRSQNENFAIISKLWKRFNAEIRTIKGRKVLPKRWEKFGITYPHNNAYRYLAAIPYTQEMQVPDHMQLHVIAPGRYARFIHTGPLYLLKTTMNTIYKTFLPKLKLVPQSPEESGLFQFERYDARFRWNSAESRLEIYVPLVVSHHWGKKRSHLNC
jgi:predicted transcriptional regulator YdeE